MPRFDDNVILLADSHKVSEYRQYFPGTDAIYVYFEAQPGGRYNEVTFFGLQYLLKRYLVGPVVTREKIIEAEQYFQNHFGDANKAVFNKAGWEYIVEKHNGYLPLRIKSLPEGMTVPQNNVLFTIENTDSKCYWLPNYLESLLSQVWYPIAVCSNGLEMKRVCTKYLEETGSSATAAEAAASWKCFDTGFRACSSVESAGIGGCAHMVHFKSTNTLGAIIHAAEYYKEELAGVSMPASEYATMTTWGGRDHEYEAYRNMLSQFPTDDVGVLSDAYDIINCCRNIWCNHLKDTVSKRNGRLMIQLRDTGPNPGEVIVECLKILSTHFECTETSAGFKVLPDILRLFVYSGKDAESIESIYSHLKESGFAADNVYFGTSALQDVSVTSGTGGIKCTMQASLATCMGQSINVMKEPATDKDARSRKGIQTVERRNGRIETIPEGRGDLGRDELIEVYNQGRLLREWSLQEIRERARGG